MSRPRLLDLFCCEGGAGMGYHRAGFDVAGVDNDARSLRRYPFQSIRADAMALLQDDDFLDSFDAIHASPPCQAYTVATRTAGTQAKHRAATGHMLPDTIAALTAWGQRTGRPWVVENVNGSEHEIHTAPWHITMCGAQSRIDTAAGLRFRLRRHRLFATNVFLWAEPCSCDGRTSAPITGHGAPGRLTASITGKGGHEIGRPFRRPGVAFTSDDARALMGCEWMSRLGLSQAIPPAYTEHIGWQLIEALK